MMQELTIPTVVFGDQKAMEIIRTWIAHNQLHVSMRLGMWEDAEDSRIDERDAWGELLADLTRHVANGMMQQYGWDYDSTRDRIRAAFLNNYDNKLGNISGEFME